MSQHDQSTNGTDPNGAAPLVEMRGISKAFGAVQALRDVNLTLQYNEILGLVGDNAAGKSTLMNILSGYYQADAGEVHFEGQKVHMETPNDARALGIETVYQDLALCENLDVASNIYLGRWPTKRRMVDFKRMREFAQQVMNSLQMGVQSPKERVENLSGGRQQSVAIARAISFEPKVLIMDEPTANLSVAASEKVLDQIRDLRAQHDVSVIIISHQLEDVFGVADRVMVLKQGQNAGERAIEGTTRDEVLELIVAGEDPNGSERQQPAS